MTNGSGKLIDSPLRVSLFSLTLYLFIFISINREASLFGLDLRYLLVFLMIITMMFSLHDAPRRKAIPAADAEKLLLVYYALIAVSSVSLLHTSLSIDTKILANVAILHLANACMLILVILNKDLVKPRPIGVAICISGIVLGLSQVFVYSGLDISILLQSSDIRTMAVDRGSGEHLNLFGQHFRVSGFAEDPNYACFFNMFCLVMAMNTRKQHKGLSYLAVVFSLAGIALSWSRTVVFGSLIVASLIWVSYALPRLKRNLLQFFPYVVAVVVLLLPILRLSSFRTMGTRYTLWTNAYHLFLNSPFFGNGLTSFRTYNALQQSGWYVHPHSSYWETLAEFGVFAFVVLVVVFSLAMMRTKKPFASFLVAAFVVFSINFDCTYLQLSILILVIIPAADSSSYGTTSVLEDLRSSINRHAGLENTAVGSIGSPSALYRVAHSSKNGQIK